MNKGILVAVIGSRQDGIVLQALALRLISGPTVLIVDPQPDPVFTDESQIDAAEAGLLGDMNALRIRRSLDPLKDVDPEAFKIALLRSISDAKRIPVKMHPEPRQKIPIHCRDIKPTKLAPRPSPFWHGPRHFSSRHT